MASPDVLLGAGLYESVRVSGGLALHGEHHLERIRSSAHALGLPAPERSAFASAIAGATGEGEVVRVRLTAAGDVASLAAERRAALTAEPVRLTVLGGWYAPGYLLREHKLTSHFHGVQGRRLAQASGYDDALLVAHDGRVGRRRTPMSRSSQGRCSSRRPSTGCCLASAARRCWRRPARSA